MTRRFGQLFDCPYCGRRSTLETAFSRWVRGHPLLDSVHAGLTIVDQDVWVHRYKTRYERLVQCLMLVEVKVNNAALTPAQRDTLYIVHNLTRNRRQTPTKTLRHQAGTSLVKAPSLILGRSVFVKAFGVHVLTFSGLGPEDSAQITWNRTVIDADKLVALLRFDLDPDTLEELDLRSHHVRRVSRQPTLFNLGD